MDSRKPVRNLSETLHSLLGLKAHLTSNWVKTVCEIVRTLPSERSAVSKPSKTETRGPFDTIDDDSGSTISRIKHEIAVLTGHINELNAQRRQVLNELLDLKGNIRVFCRIRPLTLGENLGRLRPVVALDSSNVVLKPADNKRKSYSFDKVFHPGSSQDEVFSEVEPVIKSVIDGYNACIFAYGQTGTGKTYTMEGSPDAPGVVPRAIEALFKQAGDSNHAFLVSFSMLEIYMGNLKDLLVPRPTKPTDPMPPCLSVQSDPQGGIEIENLVAIQLNDFNQALRLYRLGCRFRSTASTNSNLTSSRSHCLIRIAITCFHAPERRRETNKIWFVDLGGSERVLKTKASGRRLDEGKAINLSLSALGDVIYALQRKKSHIPYRNSKLTQVLKDSLGDDSKTLMLVHVSPKEEDLCETICSLNFATRVKSVHLGNDETIEVRQEKELALASLQQQMRKIEDERLHVRKVIQKLNKKLEDLTGIILSSDEQIETYHLSAEGPLLKNRVGDISEDPSSKLPRFMRPTVCSQRKSGTSYQTSEEKYPVRRRRRAASHRAESVNFPVKDHSHYSSDCSISRSSCLAGLNMKNSTDNATEYSQETSEADLNMIDIQERGRKAIVSISQKDENSHGQENSNGQANGVNQKRFSKVDNWFHLQKNEPAINGKSSKRGLAIPMPQKKNKNSTQSKSEKLDAEKVHKFEFTMQKVVNNEPGAVVTGGGVRRAKPEEVIDKPLTTLKDLFKKDSRSDFVSPPQTPEGKRMIQRQNSAGTSSIEDNECGTFCPPDSCCNDQCKGVDNEASTMSIMQAVEAEGQCSDSLLQKDLGSCECNSSISDVSISYSKGDSSVSIFSFEFEPCCHAVPTESEAEDGSHDFESFDTSFQTSKREKKIDLLHLRSQRALFMKIPQQNNSTISFNKPQIKAETGGICSILKQKIEILSASALLGLGFCNLGFEHDFFNGLML